MLYFTVELFIDALILLLFKPDADNKALIRRIIDIYEEETADSSIGADDTVSFYIDFIKNVLDTDFNVYDRTNVESILLKYKNHSIIAKDPEIYTILKRILTDTQEIDEDRRKLLVRKLNNAILWYLNSKSVKKLFFKLSSGGAMSAHPDKQEEIIREINNLCTEIVETNNSSLAPKEDDVEDNRIACVNFDDKEAMLKAFTIHKNITVTNKFITGLQGLNKALNGGYYMGESMAFNSLSHQGKSLILNKLSRWQFQYNSPPIGIKNPTILVLSLENETYQNIEFMFHELWINIHKALPPKDISLQQKVDFVYDELRKSGWKLIIDRRLGSEFGYIEFVGLFQDLLRQGYTPVLVVIDYMNMMSKSTDSSKVGNWLLVRELFTNCCNFCKAHNCTLASASQLNRRAAEIANMYPTGAVKKFDVSMMADSMDPQREIDVSFFMHIEKDTGGRSFWSFMWSKHRYVTDTPESAKYFAYMFRGPYGIPDDIHGASQAISNIAAVPFTTEYSMADMPTYTVGLTGMHMDDDTEVTAVTVETAPPPSPEPVKETVIESAEHISKPAAFLGFDDAA